MVRASPNDSALHWWRKNPLSVNIIAPSMSIRNIRSVDHFAKVRGKGLLIKPGSHLTAKELSQGPCWENTETFRA